MKPPKRKRPPKRMKPPKRKAMPKRAMPKRRRRKAICISLIGSIIEGWMRLSVKTPNVVTHFPAILDENTKFPKITNYTMVDLKNDA